MQNKSFKRSRSFTRGSATLSGWRYVLRLLGILLILPLELFGQGESLPPPPPGYSWQAIPQLSDEYNGQKLDSSKWQPFHPYWKGRIPSQFSTTNVVVTNGFLFLITTPMVTNLTQVSDLTNGLWVNSACISSIKPITSYGYYEARIKASHLSMTSSFWFQGKYSEIDVVEELGASLNNPQKDSLMLMNSHYYPNGFATDKRTDITWKMPSGSSDDFHTYGVWWKDANTLWYYHNGSNVAQTNTGGAFKEPMYLFFDTELFTWEGLPSLEALNQTGTNTMYVDWVRSWTLVTNSLTGPTNLHPQNP